MSIIGSNILAGASGNQGYNLNNSLRFRSSASASLTRTFATPTSGTTWTMSFWFKRGALGVGQQIFSKGNTSTQPWTFFYIDANGALNLYEYSTSGTSPNFNLATNAVFRDPSSWYHIVVTVDTTQATAANRQKVYVNGVQQTFSSASYYPQNTVTQWNSSGGTSYIGRQGGGDYLDGYMTEVNFVDGQQLTPSSFGSTNATTGVWQPAKYSGSYGTNGFYLNFNSIALTSGSNTGLGKDSSGNGNYWNTNNISVTAGTTYDAMTDVPTNTSATVANYCVMNPLDKNTSATISNGNLTQDASASAWRAVRSTYFVSSGKWYWETTLSGSGADLGMIGISNASATLANIPDANAYGYNGSNGQKYTNSTNTAYGATYASGDIIGIALDMDAGTLTFYKNNTSQGTAFTSLSGLFSPTFWQYAGYTWNTNFGQRPFTYTPPTGYVALNTYNLPTPTILQGNKYMDATLYTGTGASRSVTNAAGFQPDFAWVKCRSTARSNVLVDSNRGVTKVMYSNNTNAEITDATSLTAFNTNGFSVGSDNGFNANGDTFVGWQWQAGQGTTSSNTSGTITSTVSVNTTAGFSVVTYTGTGANATVGHGLGVAPKMVIVKKRSAASSWVMYHGSLAATQRMILETTAAVATDASVWNSTAPTSSVFSLGNDAGVNGSGATLVAYCWADVSGYSKAFSYTGNGSADGPFVYLGFRPKFIMIKRTDSTSNWFMESAPIPGYNQSNLELYAESSAAEGSTTGGGYDFLSNGFKVRIGSGYNPNVSNGTYIGMAWAENPFKNALAR